MFYGGAYFYELYRPWNDRTKKNQRDNIERRFAAAGKISLGFITRPLSLIFIRMKKKSNFDFEFSNHKQKSTKSASKFTIFLALVNDTFLYAILGCSSR